mmetsp:Transcript_146316/g.469377  ORF Transcript_146316/g.469377 Transcript_146316/m.469377 type:complete len:290 (-) Transcript_146316:55-924(-)
MAAASTCEADCLAEACGVGIHIAQAALLRHGGDSDAAAHELLASVVDLGQGAGGDGNSLALRTLLDMGYDSRVAEQALSKVGPNNLDGALALLLDAHLLPEPATAAGGGDGAGCQGSALGASASASGPVSAATLDESMLDECAICMEKLRLSDAAMRCAGSGGTHHYCHAKCLAQWAQRCRDEDRTPECPSCRGPLQLNRRRLRNFLNQGPDGGGPKAMREQDADVLRHMLDQSGSGHGDDDEWAAINWEDVAGFAIVAVAAVGVLGFLGKLAFDHFSSGAPGRRRRRE